MINEKEEFFLLFLSQTLNKITRKSVFWPHLLLGHTLFRALFYFFDITDPIRVYPPSLVSFPGKNISKLYLMGTEGIYTDYYKLAACLSSLVLLRFEKLKLTNIGYFLCSFTWYHYFRDPRWRHRFNCY